MATETNDWRPITATELPEGETVMTRIDDGRGVRNEQTLKRKGRLWFFPDMSMYVYYEPTHFLPQRMVPVIGSTNSQQR